MKYVTAIFRILNILTGVVIALCLLLAVPLVFGFRPVIVLTGSMEPAFPVGSVIYYKAAGFDDIKVGDPITFDIGNNNLATHRVIEKDEAKQSFITKGDNNPSADQNPIEYTRIAGKATDFAIPLAGHFITRVQNIPAFAVMIAILLINSFLDRRALESS